MIEKIKDSTTCPNCGKTSHDILETLYLFGLRKMKDAIRVQSWCIACRSGAGRLPCSADTGHCRYEGQGSPRAASPGSCPRPCCR